MNQKELLRSMGRKEIGTISDSGKKVFENLFSLVVDCGYDWFYHLETKGIGNDLEVSYDLTDFDLSSNNETSRKFLELINNLRGIKIISHEGYITMSFIIADFYTSFDEN